MKRGLQLLSSKTTHTHTHLPSMLCVYTYTHTHTYHSICVCVKLLYRCIDIAECVRKSTRIQQLDKGDTWLDCDSEVFASDIRRLLFYGLRTDTICTLVKKKMTCWEFLCVIISDSSVVMS